VKVSSGQIFLLYLRSLFLSFDLLMRLANGVMTGIASQGCRHVRLGMLSVFPIELKELGQCSGELDHAKNLLRGA
jgi:hypothetical protein